MAGKPWSEERKAQAKAAREAKASGRPGTAARPRPRAGGRDPVAEAVETMAGVLTLPLMSLGARNEAFLADALVLESSAQPLGAAMAEVAKVNPRIAEFLERGAPATPYLLLGTVLFSMGTQIAVNHGVNLGPLNGQTTPRGVMIAAAKERIAETEIRNQQMERELREMQETENMRRIEQEHAEAEAELAAAHDTAVAEDAAVQAIIEANENPVI